MIKPETLWSLFKTSDDSKWLGDICRALGRQDVDLDYGQRMMLKTIQQDSGWMDERMDEKRTKWAERQRKHRMSRDVTPVTPVTQCHGDIRDSHDVTIHPTTHPSNNISSSSSSSKAPTPPKDDGSKTKPKTKTSPSTPKTFSDVENYFESINLLMFDPDGVKAEFINLVRNKWIDKHGKPISDWQSYLKNICDRLNLKKYPA